MQAIVIGGSGGIGGAFVRYLTDKSDYEIITTYARHKPEHDLSGVTYRQLDITDENAVADFCSKLGEVGLFINAAGFLHNDYFTPEKSTRQINTDYFLTSMIVNTLPTLLFARYLVKHLKHKQPAVFATVSARVGSIEELTPEKSGQFWSFDGEILPR